MNPKKKNQQKHEILKQQADEAHAQGLAYQRAGDLMRAAEAYTQALKLEPRRVRSLNNLAALRMQQGKLKSAEDLLNRADNQPSSEEEQALLLNTRSQLHCRQHVPERAIRNYRQLALTAPEAINWSNLSLALSDANHQDAAERCQRLALGLNPGEDAKTLLWKPAGSAQASAQRQQLLQNLAVLQLRRDPWCQKHWQLMEARLGTRPEDWNPVTGQPEALQHLWRGENVEQLIIWDEQGYGDALQCLRWIPQAMKRCYRLKLWLRPGLLRFVDYWLNQQSGEADVSLRQFDPNQHQPWNQRAAHCPLMSLPVALELDGTSALCQAGDQPVTSTIHWPERGSIGLVWAAGQTRDADKRTRSEQRSLPPKLLEQLLDSQFSNSWRNGEIKLVNLQMDRPVPQHPSLQCNLKAAKPCKDWLETSQLLKQLDGLICVDTAIAHLAGVLGMRTLLVLNRPCDWRWQGATTNSHWYPSIKILRKSWKPESLLTQKDV